MKTMKALSLLLALTSAGCVVPDPTPNPTPGPVVTTPPPPTATDYVITVEAANLPERTGAGSSWDPLGGAPDPFAKVLVGDAFLFDTMIKTNTLYPVWNEARVASIPVGGSISVLVYDNDTAVNDFMLGCTFPSVRPGRLICQGGTISIFVSQ